MNRISWPTAAGSTFWRTAIGTTPCRSAIGRFAGIVLAAAAVGACASSKASAPAASKPAQPAATHARADLPGAITLKIGGPLPVHPIPAGFLGLSLEFPAIQPYAGTNPRAIDPVFEQLIRNLNPGQAPVLRIGGDSTDTTWWPTPGVPRPAGVDYSLTPNWLAVTGALVRDLGARVIMGVNLEADSREVAQTEAHAFIGGIGAANVDGLEPGNEPELYPSFTWDGSGQKGRPRGYDFAAYLRDFAGLDSALSPYPIAGPAIGAPKWYSHLGSFARNEARLRVLTLHRYPLQLCYVAPRNPIYPTIHHLLWTVASRQLASSVASEVRTAHSHRIPLRIDEMNTISCGTDDAVAHSFASALWTIDAVLAMATVGVDGVNIHSYPGATYALFGLRHTSRGWRGSVAPQYYGMLMAARAAPSGSRLLHVRGSLPGDLRAWATRGSDGHTRVLLLNDSSRQRRVVAVPAGASTANATVERLTAPSLTSRSHVSLDGQSFGASTATGKLAGRQRIASAAPTRGYYVVVLPAGSAALVTLP